MYEDIYKTSYVPEIDGGRKLDKSKTYVSSYVWIPKSKVPNKKALLSAAQVFPISARGRPRPIKLARERGQFVVVNRHYLSKEALARLDPVNVVPEPQRYEFVAKYQPRTDEQRAALDALKSSSGGVLELACGKGKTYLGLMKAQYMGVHTLVVVPSIGLMRTWRDEASKFLGLDESQVGIVQGNKAEWEKPVVIASIATLVSRKDQIPWWARFKFGLVIYDECHHTAAKTFNDVVPLFYGERLGLSATVERSDGLEPVYYSQIGEVFFTDLEQPLVSEVVFYKLKTKPPREEEVEEDGRKITKIVDQGVLNKLGELSISKLNSWLGEQKARNRAIVRLVERKIVEGRKIVVLSHSKEHPNILREASLKSPVLRKRTIGVINGDTSSDDRTDIIKESDVTYGTIGTLTEGINVPMLDTLIMVTPFKVWAVFQQSTGRIERPKEGKKDPITYILEDSTITACVSLLRRLKSSMRKKGYKYRVE